MKSILPATVIKSLESIERHFDNERNSQVQIYAEGRVCFTFEGGAALEMWLVRSIPSGYSSVKNIAGTFSSTDVGQKAVLNNKDTISRNSRKGNSLAEAEPGKLMDDGFRLLERTLYSPQPPNDLCDIEILWEGNEWERIPSLNKFRDELDKELRIKRAIEVNLAEAASRHDAKAEQELTLELAAQEDKIKRVRKRIATFLTATQLRSRFTLDGPQNKAKRLNLLEGPVIIEGGPGTGKTTTLINRVQYLLDTPALREAEDQIRTLSATDDSLLSRGNTQEPYRFYSPNKTLQYYLKKALQADYLRVTDQTVMTWAEHRSGLLRDLQLTGLERPFQLQKEVKGEAPWLALDAAGMKQLLTDIESHLVSAVHKVIARMQQGTEASAFASIENQEIQIITLYANDLLNVASTAEMLPLLNQLQELGAPLLGRYRTEYLKARDAVVTPLLARLRNDSKLMEQLVQVAAVKSSVSPDSGGNSTEDEVATEEIDEDTFADPNALVLPSARTQIPALTSQQVLSLVQRLLNLFVPAYALAKSTPESVRLSTRNKHIAQLIDVYLPENGYPAVAGPSRFLQLFRPVLAGPEALLLDSWPRVFRTLRIQVLYSSAYASWVNPAPNHSARVQQKTSRIHVDEVDVLLLGICTVARAFYKALPGVYENSANRYLSVFRAEIRPVVAVDEASDYSLLQLTIISQLSHPRYNCVTLCGDLMQRLGPHGLTSWQEYIAVFPTTKQATLNVSYRQCRPLLRLAARLYEKGMGEKPTYRPSGKLKIPFQLRPVIYKNSDADERFEWLVTSIIELHATLDRHIPNLAILVESKQQAGDLADRLNDDDRIRDSNTKAEACEGEAIGKANIIRVFPMTEIKGMEFDGIFIWEADLLAKRDTESQLDRLMYIALSRASFYVAVILANNWPKALQSVKRHFTIKRWDEQMLEDEEDNEANDISLDEPEI